MQGFKAAAWAAKQAADLQMLAEDRGPKDHNINIKSRHSGSKARKKGDSRN